MHKARSILQSTEGHFLFSGIEARNNLGTARKIRTAKAEVIVECDIGKAV